MEIILTAQKRKSIPLNITEIYFFWHGLKLCPASCPWCRCKKYIKFVKYWIFILNCLLHHLFADFEIYAHMKCGIKWRVQWHQPFGFFCTWTDYEGSEIHCLWIFGIWFSEREIKNRVDQCFLCIFCIMWAIRKHNCN